MVWNSEASVHDFWLVRLASNCRPEHLMLYAVVLPDGSIDDMGLKVLPPKSGEILLEIIMRRSENRSSSEPLLSPIQDRSK